MPTKLIDQLTREFGKSELQNIVQDFFNELIDNNPDLKNGEMNNRAIAEYLVNDQSKGEERLKAVQFFQRYADPLTEETSDLFGFLLHTLIKHVNKDGLIALPVRHMQTVELVDAAQKVLPTIPVCGMSHTEHQNAARQPNSNDLSHFIPESGQLDHIAQCQEVASALLIQINDSEVLNANGEPKNWSQIQEEIVRTDFDPLKRLSGRIASNIVNPGDSPLRYLFIHADKLADHPLNDPTILSQFNDATKHRLPIYIYGTGNGNASAASEFLHVDEEEIHGILLGEIVMRYHRQKIKEQNMEQKKESTAGVQFSGSNYGSVTVANGGQIDAQTTTHIHTINPENSAQLQQAMTDLLQKADQQKTISKQAYADLSQAVNEIKTELQKQQNFDRTILTKAKAVLEGFKTAAGIGTSIETIINSLEGFFKR